MSNKNTLNLIKYIQSRKKRFANILGNKIVIYPNVFPVDSPFSYSSKMTAKNIPKNAGVVLDVGTGTGIQSIIAAKRGAKKVVSVDIDDNALDNAKENIRLHKLGKIIQLKKSNLLSNVKGKFDLIISQLPFADDTYSSPISHFLFDPNFKLHEKLLKDSKEHLKKSGKIFVSSGDIANEKKLNELIKKYNYNILEIKEKEFNGFKWKLYILTLNN